MGNNIIRARIALDSLTVLRGYLTDPVIAKYQRLLQSLRTTSFDGYVWLNNYADFYYTLLQANKVPSLKEYILEKLLFCDTVFSQRCEHQAYDELTPRIVEAMRHDVSRLEEIAALTASGLKAAALERTSNSSYLTTALQELPEWDTSSPAVSRHSAAQELMQKFQTADQWVDCLPDLTVFYQQHGSGDFARYIGFRWESNCLQGITAVDPISFAELIGYQTERQQVIDNTLMLLRGYPANNLLLYGDRGTGKSSTVKALLNEYGEQGLRMIELPQTRLADLPLVLREVKGRKQKFIIFVDDLAFADNEERYTALKAVLEGGLESRPQNVVIYATSNRRHLIKEKFSERAGLQSDDLHDQVRAADTMQEKLSLADRFGITITFLSPDQRKYLEIVEGLAQQRQLQVETSHLRSEALRWERWQNGRSPRTARQFIDWLEGQLSQNLSGENGKNSRISVS
ncbi:MAG TPA: ATP-binding protein [Oscillospiraceae bacterium]|nr:ATP-binding protein [Oscillospiraceae bacterium]